MIFCRRVCSQLLLSSVIPQTSLSCGQGSKQTFACEQQTNGVKASGNCKYRRTSTKGEACDIISFVFQVFYWIVLWQTQDFFASDDDDDDDDAASDDSTGTEGIIRPSMSVEQHQVALACALLDDPNPQKVCVCISYSIGYNPNNISGGIWSLNCSSALGR